MKIFASESFISPQDIFSKERNILYGAWVGTDSFYENLIRYGTFDEYHFFVLPEQQNLNEYFDSKKYPGYKDNPRIKIKKITELPSALQNFQYTVFFTPGTVLKHIARWRQLFARFYSFPICGLTHTISYSFALEDTSFMNLWSGLESWDAIICTSRAARQAMKKLNRLAEKTLSQNGFTAQSPVQLPYLASGIAVEDYKSYDKYDSRRQLHLSHRKTIILYFGRFSVTDKADLVPLFLALNEIVKKNKDVLLLLGGDSFNKAYIGYLKQVIQKMGLSSHVAFKLNPSQQEKYQLYAASDIFVSPSDNIQETFGLTVLEAMASGLPVVISDWDGYKDFVCHGKTGFLIPTYWAHCDSDAIRLSFLFREDFHPAHFNLAQSVCVDINKMVEYLSLLIQKKSLRLAMGSAAQRFVAQNFDWSVSIARYENYWQTLVKRAKKQKMAKVKTPFLLPKYFECFRHYATSSIDRETKVMISQAGRHVYNTKNFPLQLSGHFSLSLTVVLLILSCFDDNPMRIEEIYAKIEQYSRLITREKILYHVMWMMKNHLLEKL